MSVSRALCQSARHVFVSQACANHSGMCLPAVHVFCQLWICLPTGHVFVSQAHVCQSRKCLLDRHVSVSQDRFCQPWKGLSARCLSGNRSYVCQLGRCQSAKHVFCQPRVCHSVRQASVSQPWCWRLLSADYNYGQAPSFPQTGSIEMLWNAFS
jgi:hypothetical protein